MTSKTRTDQSDREPRVYRMLAGEGHDLREGRYGGAGAVYSGKDLEAVWVSKENEEIDPGWFSQRQVDLIVQLQGKLRVEFERKEWDDLVLEPGDLLVLPGETKCRAYRWPREASKASVFFAVYPCSAR